MLHEHGDFVNTMLGSAYKRNRNANQKWLCWHKQYLDGVDAQTAGEESGLVMAIVTSLASYIQTGRYSLANAFERCSSK